MNRRFILTLGTLLLIVIAAGVAILLAKGYTFSAKEGRVVGTGIISATSIPEGASVYIDGHLTTATNTTISNLPTKSYTIKISKEGHIPWEKTIEVKEGLVTEVKATLFPSIPTIYPLTYNGVVSSILSPDGLNLAFSVPFLQEANKQKGGIWVWTMSNQPIAFNRGAQPRQIIASTPTLDFSKAKLKWSPDSKSLLVSLQEEGKEGANFERNYVVSAENTIVAADLRDITPTLKSTLQTWEDDQRSKEEIRVASIKDESLRKVASGSATLKWSPDETKFMVVEKAAVNHKAKVYDQEANKNYDLAESKDFYWLPDSRHLILLQEEKIALSDFDGSNVAIIYAGKYDNGFVFPWPDSSRLVIVSSFATPTASKPNLFGINLK